MEVQGERRYLPREGVASRRARLGDAAWLAARAVAGGSAAGMRSASRRTPASGTTFIARRGLVR